MSKVLFVATVVRKHIMEFHIPCIKLLKGLGWNTAVAARNDYDNSCDCCIPFCDEYFNVPFERNPFKIGNLRAYRELKEIIESGNYDVIHVHTPVGAMLGRLAARKARIKGTKVLYTAHGFHFFKGAPLINWLLYYPVEWLLSHITDVLITINQEDYERAKQSFKAGEVVYVPGVGVDLNRFKIVPGLREQMRNELGIAEEEFVLLSVGELIPRKNHIASILALGELQDFQNVRYLICGDGKCASQLKESADNIGVGERVRLLGYRKDIPEIMAACDVFVFPSKQEGLPVALMEAMASGLPVICSPIRGCIDLVENDITGLVVPSEPSAIAGAISRLIDDKPLRTRLSIAARNKVQEFGTDRVLDHMKSLYGLVSPNVAVDSPYKGKSMG